MSYIGNTLQAAFQSYLNIDDISGSFNGVTTSFALTVGGVAPVPAPTSSNQCLISVGGVVQRPDDTGTEGFRLSGGNIIFSSAPGTGEDFFGVVLAGADYLNVGANFPSGTAAVPSITFDTDLDTGIYNSAANELSFTTAGVNKLTLNSSGDVVITDKISHLGDTNTAIRFPAADTVSVETDGNERARIDSSGRLLVGTNTADTSGNALLQVNGSIKGTITSGTAVASTSGTSIDFTGIPSWVKRITVMFDGVSTNGTSIIQIQLGDAGGAENTGYVAASASFGGSTFAATSFTSGFGIRTSNTAADTYRGSVEFVNLSGNTWVADGAMFAASGFFVAPFGGSKTLSSTLDRVRITTVNGTDTFDAGTINILMEG